MRFLFLLLAGGVLAQQQSFLSRSTWKDPYYWPPTPESFYPAKLNEPLPSGLHLSNEEKQRHVKEAFVFAWNGYKQFSWGHDENKPVSNGARSSRNGWGATIVDALDTLYLMGLTKEFEEAKEFVAEIDWSHTDDNVQVFETVIRYVGGLLSAYELSDDQLFVDKAVELADRLLPAFDTSTGLPYQFMNFTTNKAVKSGFPKGSTPLAEVGTVQLEFTRLSEITGNWKYHDAGKKVYDAFLKAKPEYPGLYPEYIDPDTGELLGDVVTWGAMADSFYEYLIKQYIMSGGKDKLMKKMMVDSVHGLMKHMVSTSKTHPQLHYLADLVYDSQNPVMQELACFAPGTLLLTARQLPELADVEDIATNLMQGCVNAWTSTRSGLAPEMFGWTDLDGRTAVNNKSKRQEELDEDHGVYPVWNGYILRPETLESLFYFHRISGEDGKYQAIAWEIFNAIHVHCRANSGFSGVTDVDATTMTWDDRQESFFFAETLKYLYLIFDTSKEDVLPLDKWVFNTEAHPLRITSNSTNKH